MLLHDLRYPDDDRTSSAIAGEAGSGDAIFLAIQPPSSTIPCLSRLAWHLHDKHRLQGQPPRPQCFHNSLLFAGYHGQLRPETRDALINAAATVRMPPFRVAFDYVMSFRNGQTRALVLRGDEGVEGLHWLRDKLVAATIDIRGLAPVSRSFTPHLTLLYDEQEVREEPVEEISWTVTEFVLIHGIRGASRHIVLARWKLRG
jgi:RNA 2',3'-cyclic 3'-phosphodiesterase